MDGVLTILEGDARERLRELPAESVQCCVTSPPYWGLRDYQTGTWEGGESTCDHKSGRFERGGLSSKQASNNGSGGDEATSDCPRCGAKRIDAQLGLEKTPEEYVAKMVAVFREVRRTLRSDGTLWLNLGDSYYGSWANYGGGDRGAGKQRLIKHGSSAQNPVWDGLKEWRPPASFPHETLKPKDLCGIPWRVAFALQADGWWLRSDIIWAKPNPMPESVTDRPTKAHEYLFLLTKSASYFYDAEAIKERGVQKDMDRPQNGRLIGNPSIEVRGGNSGVMLGVGTKNRNKRSVWTVPTHSYPESHFATYPPDLIKPCIMAGTSAKGCCAKCGAPWERIVEHTGEVKNLNYGLTSRSAMQQGGITSTTLNAVPAQTKTLGWKPTCVCGEEVPWECDYPIVPCTVLDPFAGSGTTGAVALELGRKAVLIELNPKYAALIEQRTSTTMGLALA